MVSDFLELLSGQGFSPCIGNAGEVMFNPPKVLFFYRKVLPEIRKRCLNSHRKRDAACRGRTNK